MFAYKDQYGTMHMVSKKETAEKYASGPVAETNFPDNGTGYPAIDGKTLFVYVNEHKAYLGGNTPETGKAYDIDSNPELKALVDKIK